MGCNQLGMFSGDTNAEEMKVSGNIQMKLAEFTASVEPTERPVSAWIQQNAYANANSRSVAATASAIEPSMRKPTEERHHEHHHERHRVPRDVADGPPVEHGRRVHRQRTQAFDEALAQIFGDSEAGVDRTEEHGLGEDPRDDELLVAAVAGDTDRSSEHVDEQHHEHDRLQGREHEELGVAGQGAEVSLASVQLSRSNHDGPLGGSGISSTARSVVAVTALMTAPARSPRARSCLAVAS